MHSCYVPSSQISEDTIHINESEQHHLLNVLRLKAGNQVEVFDGVGNRYIASLCDTRTSPLQAKILRHQFHPHTPPYITLFQGLPKFDKMDLIVQKTTEIGVNEIVPMICQRSIPKSVVQQKRTARWQRIANEAAKQCKRPHFVHVFAPQGLEECLVDHLDLLILLWEGEKRQELKEILRNHGEAKSVGLFVGPEGGFTDEEVEWALQNGCVSATFGDNILRTETAAIVGMASVMYEFK